MLPFEVCLHHNTILLQNWKKNAHYFLNFLKGVVLLCETFLFTIVGKYITMMTEKTGRVADIPNRHNTR